MFGAESLDVDDDTPSHIAAVHVASVTIVPSPIAATALDACAAELTNQVVIRQ